LGNLRALFTIPIAIEEVIYGNPSKLVGYKVLYFFPEIFERTAALFSINAARAVCI